MTPLRILLAEDNPGDVFLVRQALNHHRVEYELTVAADGQKAWDLIEVAEGGSSNLFTFFLLDLNLPVRPGLELLLRIRRSSSRIARAPVVIVTSSDAERDHFSTSQAGADYFFRKPTTLEEFLGLGAIVQALWKEWLRHENGPPDTVGPKGGL
jgi:two-component system, chemotaxis family, response regulator Rcp1